MPASRALLLMCCSCVARNELFVVGFETRPSLSLPPRPLELDRTLRHRALSASNENLHIARSVIRDSLECGLLAHDELSGALRAVRLHARRGARRGRRALNSSTRRDARSPRGGWLPGAAAGRARRAGRRPAQREPPSTASGHRESVTAQVASEGRRWHENQQNSIVVGGDYRTMVDETQRRSSSVSSRCLKTRGPRRTS